jgi:hypothetical protein
MAVIAAVAGAATVLPAVTGWDRTMAATPVKQTKPTVLHATGVEDARPTEAHRSTIVRLKNSTGCTLDHQSSELEHGKWSEADTSPEKAAALVPDGATVAWASQSAGMMTGTEGTAEWKTIKCKAPRLNGRTVQFEWDNPFVGGNDYDWEDTDEALEGTITSGGDGNDADVSVEVRGK